MDESQMAPDLRPIVRRYPFKLLEYRWARQLTRVLVNFIPPVRMEGVTIEPIKGIPRLRLYRPTAQRTDGGLLWIHGGGYVVGSARVNDLACCDICRTLGMPVVSVDYGLAPEHPFPVAADDCFAAWHWLQECAGTIRIDPHRAAIGGASAGGGLAAGLVQRIHDAGGVQPVAQWLLAPMLDDRTAARRELDAINHFVWNNRMNRAAWRSYLGQEPGAAWLPPYAAPARREDVSGLPATFIGAGDIDLFYEEDRAYAERLKQHGVSVTFETVHGAPHGFEELARDSDIAGTYLARAMDWLRAVVKPGAARASSRVDDTVNLLRSAGAAAHRE